MKIDPETNLPELPDGFFWRVTHECVGIYGDYVFVGIYRNEPAERFWSYKPHKTKRKDKCHVRKCTYWSSYLSDPNHTITYLAEGAYQAFQVEREREENREYAETLLGDYPPKRL